MKLSMFEKWDKTMLTWQQVEIAHHVRRAINGGKKRISVKSGHGIGKSTILAMLILWFLFCYVDAKVPVTAPTQTQMYDVLWSEIKKWIDRMPPEIKDKYDHTQDYVRITEHPENWFARARTASKERPEALAGLHADFMFLVVDEASGVPDEIFDAAKSALTGGDVIFVMISNPTRLSGYFYDSHGKLSDSFYTLEFSSIESPIVDEVFVHDIIQDYGIDSDQYRYRVLGKFPKEDGMDKSGYLPLLNERDLRHAPDMRFNGELVMGIDPAGKGKDMTQWVIRDRHHAKIVAREPMSTTSSITSRTLTLMKEFGIVPDRIVVDNFGVGANVAQELAMCGFRVHAINVGDDVDKNNPKECEYLNLRALYYFRLQKWILGGATLDGSKEWNDELPDIKYRVNIKNRTQIMPKDEMRREGIKSPNAADALMLTFKFDIQMNLQKLFQAGSMNIRDDDPY